MTSQMMPAGGTNPLALLQVAIEKGMDPDKLGKLMDLAERWQLAQSKTEFSAAITKFQGMCPPITKKRKADRFEFASFDDIMRSASPVLAECGIGVSFTSPFTQGRYEIVCRLRVGGYHEDYPFSAPLPDLGKIASFLKLSEPQAFGFVLSYYKRYSLCAALNIVVTDEDSDAAVGVGMANITPEQVEEIKAMMAEKNVNEKKFFEWAKVERVEDITQANHPKVMDTLRRRVAK